MDVTQSTVLNKNISSHLIIPGHRNSIRWNADNHP